MNSSNTYNFTTSPLSQPARKLRRLENQTIRSVRLREMYNRRNLIKKYSGISEGKELDAETGLYYYGARYLDPRTSRWLSGDPAMGEYVPAPGQDPSKLGGMGGVYNIINLHTYHYAGNNPIKYVDPDGRDIRELSDREWEIVRQVKDECAYFIDQMRNELRDYIFGRSENISSELQESAKFWFNIDITDKTNARRILDDLLKIRNGLSAFGKNNFRVEESIKFFAAVPNPYVNIMHLSHTFFDLPNVSNSMLFDNTKHGVLFHDITHFSSVLNTRDFTDPLPSSSIILAINNPAEARRNSYNWEFFLQEYAQRR